jgi:hypothetical protein
MEKRMASELKFELLAWLSESHVAKRTPQLGFNNR